MQFYILGTAVFFFSTSFALNFYSYVLLKRSISVMRSTLHIIDRLTRDEEMFGKEGTD